MCKKINHDVWKHDHDDDNDTKWRCTQNLKVAGLPTHNVNK